MDRLRLPRRSMQMMTGQNALRILAAALVLSMAGAAGAVLYRPAPDDDTA